MKIKKKIKNIYFSVYDKFSTNYLEFSEIRKYKDKRRKAIYKKIKISKEQKKI